MRKHIKPAGKQIGLHVGWHGLRHSYRGMLDDTGANTGTQQSLMRHASITMTMNLYGRSCLKAKHEANSKVSADDPARKGALCLMWGWEFLELRCAVDFMVRTRRRF
jgi:integrase